MTALTRTLHQKTSNQNIKCERAFLKIQLVNQPYKKQLYAPQS